MAISQIPALLWGVIFGRTSVGRSTLPLNWQFHRFLLWLFIFYSSSESSTFGRPWLGTSIPLSNGNFTDSCSDYSYFILTQELNIWQTRSWQISPPSNGIFTHSCSTLRVHIWQTKCWEIYPSFKRKFHRFLLWLPTVLSFSESSTFGRPGLGRSNPLQMAVSQIPALLWEFIFGRPSVEKSTPI